MKRLLSITLLAAGLAACRDTRQPPLRIDSTGQPQRVTGGEATFVRERPVGAPTPEFDALRAPKRRVEARAPGSAARPAPPPQRSR